MSEAKPLLSGAKNLCDQGKASISHFSYRIPLLTGFSVSVIGKYFVKTEQSELTDGICCQ